MKNPVLIWLFLISITYLSLKGVEVNWSLVASLFSSVLLLLIFLAVIRRPILPSPTSIVPKTNYTPTYSHTKFTDIAGIDPIKQEVQEIVDFLQYPDKYTIAGAKLPKGLLLSGPPGTGKTLLAKAIASEAGVPFFNVAGSEFVEYFVGAGASKVRDLFNTAKKCGRAVIFIDEIDALGKARSGASSGSGNDEREQTLNQLLVEMDGFDENLGIIVIAATNRPEILDPALLRPGRFTRKLNLSLPSTQARLQILQLYAAKTSVDCDLEAIARKTIGFSGADLANLINEAAILAAKEATQINDSHINSAYIRIVAGLADKSKNMDEATLVRVANHEAGHAIVAHTCGEKVEVVSILPRTSGALGFTISTEDKDRYLLTKQDVINRIAILMAGRVAEEEVLGNYSNGASDDLRKATELATLACREWGFGEQLVSKHLINTPTAIDFDIEDLIRRGQNKATNIITQNREKLALLVKKLVSEETLEINSLSEILC